MEELAFYMPINKGDIDPSKRTVKAIASSAIKDLQKEVLPWPGIVKALSEWPGDVGEMHNPDSKIVGKRRGIEFDFEGEKAWVTSHIRDDEALAKVQRGDYSGYSVQGYRVKTEVRPDGTRITPEWVCTRIDLVDRPANPESVLNLMKRAPDDTVILNADVLGEDAPARIERVKGRKRVAKGLSMDTITTQIIELLENVSLGDDGDADNMGEGETSISRYRYIEDAYPSDGYVIVRNGNEGTYWKVPYLVNGMTVSIGEPSQVVRTYVYLDGQTVAKTAPDTTTPEGDMTKAKGDTPFSWEGWATALETETTTLEKSGATMSQVNQGHLHKAMDAMKTLHGSACKTEDCAHHPTKSGEGEKPMEKSLDTTAIAEIIAKAIGEELQPLKDTVSKLEAERQQELDALTKAQVGDEQNTVIAKIATAVRDGIRDELGSLAKRVNELEHQPAGSTIVRLDAKSLGLTPTEKTSGGSDDIKKRQQMDDLQKKIDIMSGAADELYGGARVAILRQISELQARLALVDTTEYAGV